MDHSKINLVCARAYCGPMEDVPWSLVSKCYLQQIGDM